MPIQATTAPLPGHIIVILKYFATSADLRQALENGEIDVAWKNLELADLEALQTNPNVQVVEGNGNQIRYLAFNTTAAPFDNPTLRAALANACGPAFLCPGCLFQHEDAPVQHGARRHLEP